MSKRESIARQVMKDKRIRLNIVEIMGNDAGKEMKKLCSKKVNSILRKRDFSSIHSFDIQAVIKEMEEYAPSVLTILRGCLLGRKRSKHKKLKSRIVDIDLLVSVCCALLLRGRSQRMNLLQRIISIVLYCGHTSKRVSSLNEGMKMFVIINGISFDFAHARFIPGCKSCVFASLTMPLTSVLRSWVVTLMHL